MRPIAELRIDYLPSVAVAAARLRLLLGLLGKGSLFADLIAGAPTLTAAANQGLESLADQVRRDDQLRAALETGGLERLDDYPEFAAAFREYLDNFGARETTGLVVATSPSWGESPEMVLNLIMGMAAPTTAGAGPARPERGDEAIARLSTHWVMHYRGPSKAGPPLGGHGAYRCRVPGRHARRGRLGIADLPTGAVGGRPAALHGWRSWTRPRMFITYGWKSSKQLPTPAALTLVSETGCGMSCDAGRPGAKSWLAYR